MVVCAESFYNLGSLSFSKPVCIPKGKLSTPLSRLSFITWETLRVQILKGVLGGKLKTKRNRVGRSKVGTEEECIITDRGQMKHLARIPQETDSICSVVLLMVRWPKLPRRGSWERPHWTKPKYIPICNLLHCMFVS